MKLILTCIYMRTMLSYDNLYLDSKLLTKIYYKIIAIEKKLSKSDKALYLQCSKIATKVWLSFKTDSSTKIRIEPYITNLYFSNKQAFIKQGFKPTLINKMFDSYYNKYDSVLEVESRDFSEELMDETLKTLQGYLDASNN